jgi:fatty acid desaturase
MTDQRPDRPEQPRTEPEIIPPGRAHEASRREASAIWISMGPGGTQRIQFGKPRFSSLVFLVLAVAFLTAMILVVLFGAVLIFIPVVILLFAAAVVTGLWQRFFQQPR